LDHGIALVGDAPTPVPTPTPVPPGVARPLEPTAAQRKAKLDLAAAQPAAAAANRGKDMPAATISDLTEAEFDQLPEATKRRLRGDVGVSVAA